MPLNGPGSFAALSLSLLLLQDVPMAKSKKNKTKTRPAGGQPQRPDPAEVARVSQQGQQSYGSIRMAAI